MPHDYEYMSSGVDIYAAERERKEAQKKSICNFVNSLDYKEATLLKTIKQQYNEYSDLNKTITNINNNISNITNELNSILTIRQTTKDKLNQQLTDLRRQLRDVGYYKLVVDNNFDNYRNINELLSISEFFSDLNSCEIIPHARAEVLNTNGVPVAEAIRIRNKYLKYKQKYLSLKNKIN